MSGSDIEQGGGYSAGTTRTGASVDRSADHFAAIPTLPGLAVRSRHPSIQATDALPEAAFLTPPPAVAASHPPLYWLRYFSTHPGVSYADEEMSVLVSVCCGYRVYGLRPS